MKTFSSNDVFTPTKPAELTFIERLLINDRLVDALRTPGKQLVVYGHSGSGKTTLLINKLKQIYEDNVTTRCMHGMSLEQVLLDAFDQVGSFYESERSTTKKVSISSSTKAQYIGIKSSIKALIADEHQVKEQRILPPQLTPQKLAMFLGEAKCCWVLEDFHKIDQEEKKNLSQIMKIFMDMAGEYNEVKIIAIGAVGTAREVVQYDAEMKNRVAEILVPLMSADEIKQILKTGEQLLNIKFSKKVKKEIITYSNGLASVCHQLSLNICFNNNIYETPEKSVQITMSDLRKALTTYIENESDSIKLAFDKAFKKQRKQKYDNCYLIVQALTKCNFEDGATRSELMRLIKQKEKKYPEGNLTVYLKEIQSESRGSLIIFNDDSGKYSFTNPFYMVFANALFNKPEKSEKIDITTIDGALDNLLKELKLALGK